MPVIFTINNVVLSTMVGSMTYCMMVDSNYRFGDFTNISCARVQFVDDSFSLE